MEKPSKIPQIVIVGGGAGGLELATLLGKKFGRQHKAHIILVDQKLTHIWKPLWHEVAAGTLYFEENEVNYLIHANRNYYEFEYGKLENIDRQKKQIVLADVLNEEGKILISSRKISYDILILAVGSQSNDFNILGAYEYCFTLDSQAQAKQFQQEFLRTEIELQYQHNKILEIAIIGAGATGVELAAELNYALKKTAQMGWKKIKPERVRLSLIEAADRILPGLPERISQAVAAQLESHNVKIHTHQMVEKVTPDGIQTKSGLFIPAQIKIWAAGIKAAEFLKNLDLETIPNNQIKVKATLQTTIDPNIFAFGDCAYCIQEKTGKPVPARAQAAHQQAYLLVKSVSNYLKGKPLPKFHYHDYGSLISLSHRTAVGYLAGTPKSIFLEGKLARFFYWSLFKKHQMILLGWWRVFLLTLSNWLTRRIKPRLKLH